MRTFTVSLLRTGGNVSLVKTVWVLVYPLVKSFCRILSENSVVVHVLRGQLFGKQHSAVFTRYFGAYFIGKYAIQVLLISVLENSLKLVWCLGVQRREQISWNLWCLSCRRCPLICPFLIWIDEKIQFGYFLKDVFHLVCSPQSLLHVSFRSKTVRVHQNCFDLRRLLRTPSHEHISLFANERHWHPWLTEQRKYVEHW